MAKTSKLLAGAVAAAVGLLTVLEGNPGKPYYDIAGVLTECYGNTKGVDPNVIKTEEECRELLQDEAYRIGKIVVQDNPNAPVSVVASGISFTYNVGDYGYRRSTFRRELRRGNYEAACESLRMWDKFTDPGTGRLKVSKGLQNRRDKEVELCLQDVE